jgi:hypothetical protein
MMRHSLELLVAAQRWQTALELNDYGECVMQSPAKFRQYADDCKQLAKSMPQHKAALLTMAEAWIACAEAAERQERNGERPPEGAGYTQKT